MKNSLWIYRSSLSLLMIMLLASCVVDKGSKPGGVLTKNLDDLPKTPILQLETGSHHSHVRQISIDSAETILATCGADKTVRVWDIATGKLRRVLRVPINQAQDGTLNAVALSPDGRMVATSGWTGGLDEHNIYLLDTATGAIIHRISPLPNVIVGLAFSRDGRYLAAIFGGNEGLRVYETDFWHQVAKIPCLDNSVGSYGVSFGPDGRLVFASMDGYVRLMDKNFNFFIETILPEGREPNSVAFSPDGTKIAVGLADTRKVVVLSSQDLSTIFVPETTGMVIGTLSEVAWSADGKQLYAAGHAYFPGGDKLIRDWSAGGFGGYNDFLASQGIVKGLIGLKNGDLLFGGADPVWAKLGPKGEWKNMSNSPSADMREIGKAFKISKDGQTIQFAFEFEGKRPAIFNNVSRNLYEPSPHDLQTALTAPITNTALGLTRSGSGGNFQLSVEETQLESFNIRSKAGDFFRSWAIAPDGQSFLIGTEWSVYCFDRNGRQKWIQPATVAWGVNVSGDGKLAVAALSDGTINWYRMDNGEKLLTFFPHKDGKRWVLWTPSGYYAASPGGEDLIGWHVNHGRDQAPDFFPASRFRGTYYRPQVTSAILTTLDEKAALAKNSIPAQQTPAPLVEAVLPPVVTILSPEENTPIEGETATISMELRFLPDAPPTQFKVMVDGRPIEIDKDELKTILAPDASRTSTKSGETRLVRKITVQLPQEEASISLIAENRHAASDPATIRLNRKEVAIAKTTVGPATSQILKPRLYLLAIGVSAYQQKDLALAYAAKDATDLVRVFKNQTGKIYSQVEIKLLSNATKEQILNGLEWIERETTSRDVAMLFFAGHGLNDRNGNYYFLPVDGNPKELKSTGIAYAEIKNTVSGLPGKVIAFLDTCHAGDVMGSRRRGLGQVDIDRISNELSSTENGVVVFASSTGTQNSLEDDAWKNGAFTKALIEGLEGKADYNPDSKITINELDTYLAERVKTLTNGQQTPTTAKPQTIADFPIVVF